MKIINCRPVMPDTRSLEERVREARTIAREIPYKRIAIIRKSGTKFDK